MKKSYAKLAPQGNACNPGPSMHSFAPQGNRPLPGPRRVLKIMAPARPPEARGFGGPTGPPRGYYPGPRLAFDKLQPTSKQEQALTPICDRLFQIFTE